MAGFDPFKEKKKRKKNVGEVTRIDLGTKDGGAHYRYHYRGIKVDPYRIFAIYKITHGAHQHVIKKLLRAGKSVKSLKQDIKESIDSLNRWLEMLEEDERDGIEPDGINNA